MKKLFVVIALLLLTATALSAQQADTTSTMQDKPVVEKKEPGPKKIYYGGTVGLSFGNYTRIRIAPMVGYRLAPKVSGGIKIAYEYIEDKRYAEKFTSSNYGGSVFARYRVVPQMYAHAEYAAMSYEYKTSATTNDRQWVPFLLLGGGVVMPIGPGASAYAEVLVDVLNDDKSPYEDWRPWVSIGVAVGF